MVSFFFERKKERLYRFIYILGNWDYPLPKCENINDDTQYHTSESTDFTESQSTSSDILETSSISDTFDWNSVLMKINKMEHNITREFLQYLREYYFYGCESKRNLYSPFCYNRKNISKFEDLTNFEPLSDDDLNNVDEMWLEILQDAIQLTLVNSTMQFSIGSEDLLDYLIQDITNNSNNTKSVVDTYRLYFCFYIDSIIMEDKINNFTIFNNSKLEKIQLLVAYFIIPIYEEYMKNVDHDNLENFGIFISPDDIDKFTTFDHGVRKNIQCNFDDFTKSINFLTIVSEVHTIYGALTLTDYLANGKTGALPGEKLNFICPPGLILVGDSFSICEENGNWSNINSFCQGVYKF